MQRWWPVLPVTAEISALLTIAVYGASLEDGDYPNHSGPSQVINSGGAYRFTATQQIDFHAGFGPTNRAPNYFFGLGYSVRFDRLF